MAAVTRSVRLLEGVDLQRAGPEASELREEVATKYFRDTAMRL